MWMLHGRIRTGRLEVHGDRLELLAGAHAFGTPFEAIASLAVERALPDRIKGLRVLALTLLGGDVLRIASLGGAGSHNEIVSLIGAALEDLQRVQDGATSGT